MNQTFADSGIPYLSTYAYPSTGPRLRADITRPAFGLMVNHLEPQQWRQKEMKRSAYPLGCTAIWSMYGAA
jgi:hypothetical protein